MQVIVDSLLTNYEQTGKGKDILLLPGWGETLATFHDLQSALRGSYLVTALDLPGFGQTQAPAETWSLDNYAEFIAKFLKKTGVKPYAIIAHSNGGAIAMRGLANRSLKTSKLVLLASSGIRTEYRGRVKAIRIATKAGKALAAPLPTNVKKRLRQKVYETVGSDMLVAEHLQDTFKKVVSDDVQADAGKLVLPTLLIYGDEDKAAPLAYGQKFHELIKGSQLEVVDGAGHFVHHDQPALVLRYIEEFLK